MIYSRLLDVALANLKLDRCSDRRIAKDWISSQLQSPEVRFIILNRRSCFHLPGENTDLLFNDKAVRHLAERSGSILAFLGKDAIGPIFAIDISDQELSDKFLSKGSFLGLRDLFPRITAYHSALFAYASHLLYWLSEYQFCLRCGQPLSIRDGGHSVQCGNYRCQSIYFPRVDLAVIVRVESDDECLFVHQAEWADNRYSFIAGFLEPGETCEEAVMREVNEETNLRVHTISYRGSQPWPFPQSLMLSYSALSDTREYLLKDRELDCAQWLSRDAYAQKLADGAITPPSRLSVAYSMLQEWMNREEEGRLERLLSPNLADTLHSN